MWHTIHTVQYVAHYTYSTVCGTLYIQYSMWHTIHTVQYVAHYTYSTVCGTLYIQYSMWHTIHTVQYVAHYTYSTVCCTLYIQYRVAPRNLIVLSVVTGMCVPMYTTDCIVSGGLHPVNLDSSNAHAQQYCGCVVCSGCDCCDCCDCCDVMCVCVCVHICTCRLHRVQWPASCQRSAGPEGRGAVRQGV